MADGIVISLPEEPQRVRATSPVERCSPPPRLPSASSEMGTKTSPFNRTWSPYLPHGLEPIVDLRGYRPTVVLWRQLGRKQKRIPLKPQNNSALHDARLVRGYRLEMGNRTPAHQTQKKHSAIPAHRSEILCRQRLVLLLGQ